MPNDAKKRTGYKSFVESHIPKAQFFDLDAVKDEKSPYPHMLPPPELFAEAMGKLGIRKDDSVVVYDSAELGIFSAPRVAWTLKVFGHGGVHILNNYKLWVDQGYPVEKGEPEPVERVHYPVPTLDSNKVTAFEELKRKVATHGKEGAEKIQVLDARPAGRFEGTDPEPRPGISQSILRFASKLTRSRSFIWSYARQYFYPLLRRYIRSHKNFPPGRRVKTLL
jgi:thiosulfate/3-mercaptopyruvate sulfurtransferase